MDRSQAQAGQSVSSASASSRGFRSGFVSLVGRPNVGKSTILNYYLGEKISIVSPRPQTTRQRVLGVLTRSEAQVLFLDSPGLHKPQHTLGRHMVEVAKAILEEADVIVAVIDARAGLTVDDERIFARIRQGLASPPKGRQAQPACLLAMNKIDAVKKPLLLPLIDACAKTKVFSECIPISALTGQQMDVLLRRIIAALPEGPPWYTSTHRTDQTTTQRIGELIREQVLLVTRQEVPHAVAVLVEQVEERERVTAIHATILVERQGQKAIIIGRNGLLLKRIGQAARHELERLLGRKVYVELWVKVAEGWRSDSRILRQLGYVS